ncbi:MAG: right-handed parallel beta-helix repeat-containing protein, partial [Candidatus Thorarchaeota archaeon]
MTQLQDSLSWSGRVQRLLDFNTGREEREPMLGRDRVSHGILSLMLFMFLLALATNVTPVTDLEGIAHQSTTAVSKPERRGVLVSGTPHGAIAIDGDANFSDTALLEGWEGDGSPENPYLIDGLDIDLGGEVGHCISISNTRVSFTISNCNLTGAGHLGSYRGYYGGTGIYLENVTNGELVNNICTNNNFGGIYVEDSDYNTVVNNTCSSNDHNGISLVGSDSNTVANNTCNSNDVGIRVRHSDSNTVANNICNSNTESGIYLDSSHDNIVVNNTCNNNGIYGIHLYRSDSNTVANNTCNSNEFEGINIEYSSSNIITNNTLNGCGFFFRGDLTQCRQLEVTGNSVNGLPLVFLQDQVGNVVPAPAGQVILVGCSQVTVKDLTLMDCSAGVLLCHTSLTTLVNNTCNSNTES